MLRTIRGGGADLDASRAIELLERADVLRCTRRRASAPAPLELVVSQKPE